MPVLDAQPLDAEPADPEEWREAAEASGPMPGNDGAPGGAPPEPQPAAIDRERIEAAVRVFHHGLWTGLRSDDVGPIDSLDMAAIVAGLVPLAQRWRFLSRVIGYMSVVDPASGLPKLVDVEHRAHVQLLPQPWGTGEREPDGWVMRLVAWAKGLGAVHRRGGRAMVPGDGGNGAGDL